MLRFHCPAGHDSETPDFCSVCGVEVRAGSPVPALVASSGAGAGCPECGMPREGQAVFCEGCGFDYRKGAPPTPARKASPPPAATASFSEVRWDVVVRVDATLYGPVEAAAPVDQPAQTFTLFETENMIGREGTGVRVQIPIRNDHGVSRRHALLIRQADGGLVLRDLNSANGTQLNGKDVLPGADLPLRDGDTVALGAWTSIAIRAVPS